MNKTINSRFGDAIRNQMRQFEISQKELGERIGVSQKVISKYVNGKSEPNFERLQKICMELRIDFNSILGIDVAIGKTYHLSQEEEEIVQQYRKLGDNNKNYTFEIMSYIEFLKDIIDE